jgi:Fimbrial assembly protein (PilN)
VSPLLRSRLLVFIGPERLSVYKLAGGVRPKLVASHTEALEPPQAGGAWPALAQKLGQVLAIPELRAAEADIILSNKLARHALVPYNAQLKKAAERELYARHVLGKTYGRATAQWELRLSHQKGGAHWIVSAIDRTLVEALQHAFAANQSRVLSIRSRLTLAYNHHKHRSSAEPAWLVIREAGFSLFARLEAGRVVGLGTARHEALNELPSLLDRENLSSGQHGWCKKVYVVAAEDETATVFHGGEYEIDALDPIPLGRLVSHPVSLAPPRRGLPSRLQLDFLRRPETENRRAGWMLLAAGVFMAAEMGYSCERLTHERVSLTHEMTAAHISMGVTHEERFSDKELDAAHDALSRLHTPWEDFFTGLESISNKRVAVLSVIPDMQTGILRVSGVARDNAALLTLLGELRRTKPFSEVYLASQETSPDDRQRLLRFVIRMRWDGLK